MKLAGETINGRIAEKRGDLRGSSIWEPTQPARRASGPLNVAIPIEQDLLQLFLMPNDVGLAHREFHLRKEREILALLDRLTPIEALALQRRLENPAASDPLAKAFARLVADRRQRVVCYLADTRRRLATRR